MFKNRIFKTVAAMAAISMLLSAVPVLGEESRSSVIIYGSDISAAGGTVTPTTETWDGGVLTVGKIRKNPADVNSGDYYAAYSFETEQAGVYSMLVSANRWDLAQYSAYALKVDDGEYITVSSRTVKNEGTYDRTEYGTTTAYALRSFEMKEKLYLEPGEHTLYIKAVTNSFSGSTPNGITVYFNSAEFVLNEPDEVKRINGNEYISVSEPDMLSVIGVSGAPTVTLFKGDSLPDGGITISYYFYADYDGYYDITLSKGNYNNVYLSDCAIAVDDAPFVRVDSVSVGEASNTDVQADMCIYKMKTPVYLTKGKHSFSYKLIDECLNNVYEYFEYAEFSLREDVSAEEIYAVNDGGEKIYALSEADAAGGCVTLSNYTDADKTVSVISALFNDAQLKETRIEEVTVPAGESKTAYTDSFALSHEDGEALAVMVWDDMNRQQPIAGKYQISGNGIDNVGYDEEIAMLPLWQGNRTYNETVLMVSGSGNVADAEGVLYHTPKRIASVMSADLQTEYKEGVDWEYKDGKLRLLEGSKAPYLTAEQLYETGVDGYGFWNSSSQKKVLYAESVFWHEHQIAVTYDHDDMITENIPEYAGDVLEKTAAKLAAGEAVSIVLNGDSISTGANMSGMRITEPFMPIWGELFYSRLRREYTSDIEFHNTSRGAQTSVWAAENVNRNITRYKPDLAVIAFGMNDASGAMKKAQFKQNISSMIDAVRAESPDTEFILVSGIAANPDAGNVGMTIPELREGLYELSEEYDGVAVADVTAVHNMLLEKKAYMDMTGNNINHINDYMGRWYAQILSAMLINM